MVQFDPAFAKALKNEGGYTDDPRDPGRESYKGISRRFHPDWPGWKLIDSWKAYSDFRARLEGDAQLQALVRAFYLALWTRYHCDQFPHQGIAEEFFDAIILPGPGPAVTFLQRALNVINGNRKPKLVVDGNLGPLTLAAVLAVKTDADRLVRVMAIRRGEYFLNRIEENPAKVWALGGWLTRLNL